MEKASIYYLILKSLLSVVCGVITTITTYYTLSIILFALLLNSVDFLENKIFTYGIYFISGLMGGIITSIYSNKYFWINISLTAITVLVINFFPIPIISPATLPFISSLVVCLSILLGGYIGIGLRKKWAIEMLG